VAFFAAIASSAEAGVVCKPAKFDETTNRLTLTFDAPHGRMLSVAGPGSAYYWLAWEPGHSGMTDPEPVPDFADARRVTIHPQTLVARRATPDGEVERVFQAPGVYTIRSANVLETDYNPPEDPLAECEVTYAPR
jgi:hypothetical protein